MAFSTDEGDDLCKGFEHMANEEELLVCGSTDELTGKKLIPQTEREDLFLPGRILHIHKRKEKRYYNFRTNTCIPFYKGYILDHGHML